jgi:hypothetical protein
MLLSEVLEIVLPIVSIMILISYHLYILIMFFFCKKVINLGYQSTTREQWIYWVMFTPKAEILGIQSFRNALMAAAFLGSLSSGLAFYVMTRATKELFLLKRVQLYILSGIFFTSFMCFAMFVRYVLHTIYLVTCKDVSEINKKLKIETKKVKEVVNIEVPEFGKLDPTRIQNRKKAVRNMNILTIYFSLGIRFSYLGVPFALWASIGPFGFLGGSFFIIAVLLFHDHI